MKTLLICLLIYLFSAPAFAQDMSQAEQQEAELEAFKQFIGGPVFMYGVPGYPTEKGIKWTCTFLAKEDRDLYYIMEDPVLLREFGRPLGSFYKSNGLYLIGFVEGESEVLVSIKVGKEYYEGFKLVSPEVVERLQQHDKK